MDERIVALSRKASRTPRPALMVSGQSDPDDAEVFAQELARYSGALLKAGYRVEPDPDDDEVLLVQEAV